MYKDNLHEVLVFLCHKLHKEEATASERERQADIQKNKNKKVTKI